MVGGNVWEVLALLCRSVEASSSMQIGFLEEEALMMDEILEGVEVAMVALEEEVLR